MTRACQRPALAEERPLLRSRHAQRSLDATVLTSRLQLSSTTGRQPASWWLPVFSYTWILAILLTVSSGAHATRNLQQQQPGGGAPAPAPGVAYAATSLEFIQALYAAPRLNTTEIRLLADIVINRTEVNDASAADPDARPAVAGGPPAVQLVRNLTVVGAAEGSVTLLDWNFLTARVMVRRGVTLTFSRVELFKALNRPGQYLDFMARSDGGIVVLNSGSINYRPVCFPFDIAVAQLLSLPGPTQLPVGRDGRPIAPPPRDVSLRNSSAFCWTNSSLVAICKQPAIEMRSYSVAVPAIGGVLNNNGGYDVVYRDAYIVCEYEVDRACLEQLNAEACLNQELVRRYGMGVSLPPTPPSPEPTAPGAASPGGGGGGTNVGLAVGLAVGLGGGLLAIVAVLAVLLYRRRRTDGGGRKRNGGGGRGDDEHGDSSYGRQQRQLQQQGQHPQQLAGSGADPNSLAPGIVAGPTAMAGGPKYYEAQQQAFREGMMYGMAGVGPGGTVTIGGPGTSSGTKDSGTASAATTASTSTSRAGALMSGGGIGGGGWSNVRAGGGVGMLPAVGEGEVELMGAGAFGAAAQRPGFSGADDDIERLKRSLFGTRGGADAPLNVQVLQLLGEGSFGKVYKGIWQGTVVALKAMSLPGVLSADERRQQMALMEAAISSSLAHPNIVQTYTYSFRKLTPASATARGGEAASSGSNPTGSGEGKGGPGGAEEQQRESEDADVRAHGHELLLVLEYCDRGSLRQALDSGTFHRIRRVMSLPPAPGSPARPPAIGPTVSTTPAIAAGRAPSLPLEPQLSLVLGPPPQELFQQQQQPPTAAAAAAVQPRGEVASAGGEAAVAQPTQQQQQQQQQQSPTALSATDPMSAVRQALGSMVLTEDSSGWATPEGRTMSNIQARPVSPDRSQARAGPVGEATVRDWQLTDPSQAHAGPVDEATVRDWQLTDPSQAPAGPVGEATVRDWQLTDPSSAGEAKERERQSPDSSSAPAGPVGEATVREQQQQGAGMAARGTPAGMGGGAAAAGAGVRGAAGVGGAGNGSRGPVGGAVAGGEGGGRSFGPLAFMSVVEERREYDYSLMLQIASDVSSALLHLHSRGVVHGDIKASNVLLKTSEERRTLSLPAAAAATPGLTPPLTTFASSPPVHAAAPVTGPSRSSGSAPQPPHGAPSTVGEQQGHPAPRMSGSSGRGGSSSAAGPAPTGIIPARSSSEPFAGATSGSATGGGGPGSVGTGASSISVSGPGLTAKVADFGLSTFMGHGEGEMTHISAATAQGSLSHMAPELMLHGHISKRVDVYAFGIMLWELFTGEKAHRGVPRALLPHQVAIGGLRPVFPPYTPEDYKHLAEGCWQADPAARPAFGGILAELERMRGSLASQQAAAMAAAAAGDAGGSLAADGGVGPDGWVTVPPPPPPPPQPRDFEEAATISTGMYAEMVGTTMSEELYGGGRGGVGGFGGS